VPTARDKFSPIYFECGRRWTSEGATVAHPSADWVQTLEQMGIFEGGHQLTDRQLPKRASKHESRVECENLWGNHLKIAVTPTRIFRKTFAE